MRRLAPLILVVLAGCGGSPRTAAQTPAAGASPFHPVRASKQQQHERGRFLTARIRHAVRLRSRPGGRRLERLRRRTEFGSPKVVGVLRRRAGWLQVVTPERPNKRPGWIPASAARLGSVDVSISVDRSARRLVVRRAGRVVHRMPVAVGRPGTETPVGRFAITDRLRSRSAASPYGCCALALSGHQTKLLPGWPGGDRLAIHATPNPETVGHPASLGCLRAKTRDMRALMRIVPLGAPVFVRM